MTFECSPHAWPAAADLFSNLLAAVGQAESASEMRESARDDPAEAVVRRIMGGADNTDLSRALGHYVHHNLAWGPGGERSQRTRGEEWVQRGMRLCYGPPGMPDESWGGCGGWIRSHHEDHREIAAVVVDDKGRADWGRLSVNRPVGADNIEADVRDNALETVDHLVEVAAITEDACAAKMLEEIKPGLAISIQHDQDVSASLSQIFQRQGMDRLAEGFGWYAAYGTNLYQPMYPEDTMEPFEHPDGQRSWIDAETGLLSRRWNCVVHLDDGETVAPLHVGLPTYEDALEAGRMYLQLGCTAGRMGYDSYY